MIHALAFQTVYTFKSKLPITKIGVWPKWLRYTYYFQRCIVFSFFSGFFFLGGMYEAFFFWSRYRRYFLRASKLAVFATSVQIKQIRDENEYVDIRRSGKFSRNFQICVFANKVYASPTWICSYLLSTKKT